MKKTVYTFLLLATSLPLFAMKRERAGNQLILVKEKKLKESWESLEQEDLGNSKRSREHLDDLDRASKVLKVDVDMLNEELIYFIDNQCFSQEILKRYIETCYQYETAEDLYYALLDVFFLSGADINVRGNNGKTLLHYAANVGSFKIYKLVLERGASIFDRGEDNKTTLHYAVLGKNRRICSSLVASDINIKAVTDEGSTALHFAAGCGLIDILKDLITAGAMVNQSNHLSLTPLHVAAISGQTEMCGFLVNECGAKVDALCASKQTSLRYAAFNGDIDACRMLIECGAMVDARDKQQMTALGLAASLGHLKICSLLIENGASVDSQDENGNSPLFMAGLHDHKEVSTLLMEKGANFLLKNNDGNSPINFLCGSFNQALTYAILMRDEKGILEAFRSIENTTPSRTSYLQAAATGGLSPTCFLLCMLGIDVDYQNTYGRTALHMAAFSGHVSTCSVLIGQGASLDIVDNNGMTPILRAVASDQADVCTLLIEKGANAKIRYHGLTPLHIASSFGRIDLCKALLAQPSLLLDKDNNGNTPLVYAAEHGKRAACCALMTHALFLPPVQSRSIWDIARKVWNFVTFSNNVTSNDKIVAVLCLFKRYNVPKDIAHVILLSDDILAEQVFTTILPLIHKAVEDRTLVTLLKIVPRCFASLIIDKLSLSTLIGVKGIASKVLTRDLDDILEEFEMSTLEERYLENIKTSIAQRIGL